MTGSSRRQTLLTGPVLLVVLISVGCGGGAAGSRTSATVTGANALATVASSSSAPSVGASDGAGSNAPTDGVVSIASGSDSTSSGGPSSGFPGQGKDLPVTATLARQCVVPGTSQTITITTAPNSAVGYHSIYSDGKQGFDQGYYGGNKSGLTDATGRYSDSWVIAPNAPAGNVTVDVVGISQDGSSGKLQLSFAMSGVGGCS